MGKVLVLGAGASLAYGYPLGGALRTKIIELSEITALRAGIVEDSFYKSDVEILTEFQQVFRGSQMYSIDAFLARRPEYSEIGKKCIAAVLLQLESEHNLFSEGADRDHWYQYLFNHWAKNDWDDLSFDDVSIITFNYDRSLEHFLFHALQSAYNKSASDVCEKMKSLKIIHVYGCLSDVLPGSENYEPYDGGIDAGKVERAASRLVVIPEGRIDSHSLQIARDWLLDATGIAFLGFGFDATNIERLAAGGACMVAVNRPGRGHIVRTICGSRVAMYDEEIERAYMSMVKEAIFRDGVNQFHEKNCIQTLRITQFLL